nr:flagellin [Roseibium aestuarii]
MPVISTNTAANTAVRYLNMNSADQSASLAKLASGSRITTASDDAAGLAIATKLSSDVTALEQAATNASHGISILQTADAGASNTADILERMKTLASQAASGTVTDTERTYIQAEFEELMEEIDDISTATRYNGQSLLDGTSDFSDDTVKTAAEVTTSITGAAKTTEGGSGTAAVLSTSLNAAITVDASSTFTFDVNGETVSLTADGSGNIALQDVVDGINAVSADSGVTAALNAGKLELTSTATGAAAAITIDNAGGTTSTVAADITLLGITDTGSDDTETVNGSDTLFTLAASETVSFDVNGTKVELTGASGGTDYTAASLATDIQAALTAAGVTDVTVATGTNGGLEFTSSAKGAAATITIDNFTGNIDGSSDAFVVSDLGLTETAAGEVTAAGESDAFTLTAGQVVSFDVNDVKVSFGSADSTAAATFSAADVASAITTALADAGKYDLKASVDATTGEVSIASRATGEKATVTIDNFTGTTDGSTAFSATTLGMTATTDTGTETAATTTGADVVVGSDYTDTITLTIQSLTTSALGIDKLNVATQAGAEEALAVLDSAINTVSQARAEMGATVSRLEYRSTQLESSIENLEAAKSAISDVDIASEQASLSASAVKVQAAVAAASQANQMPQNLLKLLN